MIINSAKYSCAAGHDINEDSCLCDADKGIFIVADGLGGHLCGEKASLAAVDYFEENCKGGISGRISELMEGANTAVLNNGGGGKTTVAAAFTENGNFIYANAGDSRVYYFRDGRIIAQTKDHSVCQASVDMGMISPDDIRGSEDRSRLLKVLGSEGKLNIKKEYPPVRIRNGDAFLVCSDGFWEYVYETEMEADLLKSESPDAWLKYMLKRHILRAENKGDNYTAICGMIFLDGTETYIEPVSVGSEVSDAPVKIPKSVSAPKNRLLLPITAAGILAIAVAAVLSVFLLGNRSGASPSDRVEITVPSESRTEAVPKTTEMTEEAVSSEVLTEAVPKTTGMTEEAVSSEVQNEAVPKTTEMTEEAVSSEVQTEVVPKTTEMTEEAVSSKVLTEAVTKTTGTTAAAETTEAADPPKAQNEP